MMLHTKYQGSMPCGFRHEDFSMFLNISLCKTCDPQRVPIFAPRHNLNKRSTRWCYILSIKALGLVVLDKKIF